jgi:hypothetical protein
MEVGSAENCETRGAAGFGGSGFTGGGGGGAGGGGTGFFLHPATNSTSSSAIKVTVIFRLFNMNIAS